MPTVEQMHAFLALHYKHARFAGRDTDPQWWPDYSWCIAKRAVESLQSNGTDLISQHESQTGRAIRYNAHLEILS